MNHSTDDYYQPGALIHFEESDIKESGDKTTTTYQTWTTIGSNPSNNLLSLSYTPPVDAIALLYGQTIYYFSATYLSAYFGLYNGGDCIALNYQLIDTITTRRTFICAHYLELTADTAYTFYGKYYLDETSGTMTILEENYETFLHLLVWRKP